MHTTVRGKCRFEMPSFKAGKRCIGHKKVRGQFDSVTMSWSDAVSSSGCRLRSTEPFRTQRNQERSASATSRLELRNL